MLSLPRIMCRAFGLLALVPALAKAQVTPGYPERVLQWTVQPGETCEQVAAALYGSEKFAYLLTRYNEISCASGDQLTVGLTLVVPERVTNLATATLDSLSPEVRARVGGGDWFPASPGMPLHRNDSVNTLERARADILFADRTHVVMAEHTLVVVYDTASQSTATQRSPSAVLLEEGELQTALAALRPKSESSIAVKGGGQVHAKSKDTVVRKIDKRTTVSVFDGTARISSGGATVQVPAQHGSSFVIAQRPTPPRPLPPPPTWQHDCTHGTVLAASAGGSILAQWSSMPNAKFYRVEFAHDPQFSVPIVREAVPPTITSFRAEKLPPGSYYVRVRTVDNDDFLGIASDSLTVEIVQVNRSGVLGTPGQASIVVSPYETLTFARTSGVQMALDGGPFGPLPPRIDFWPIRHKELKFRRLNDRQETTYRIEYRPLQVEARLLDTPQGRKVVASFTGVDPSELWTRLKPAIRLSGAGSTHLVHMTPAVGTSDAQATLPRDALEPLALEIVDQQNTVLTRVEVPARAATPRRKQQNFATGPCAPIAGMDLDSAVAWWAPTTCNAASVAAKLADFGERGPAGQGLVRVSGMFGAFGVDALIQSNTGRLSGADNLAWFRARWRAINSGAWSLGPALRLGLPATSGAAREQLESGLALAWQDLRWSWISDLGFRSQAHTVVPHRQTTMESFYFMTGGTYDVHYGFIAYAVLDAHLRQQLINYDWSGRAGLSLGLESSGPLFVGFGTRFSPFDSPLGNVTSQLGVGIRN